MLKHWFPQGVITSLAATVLALIGGAVLAELMKHNSPWATPAMYGLVGFASIAVGVRAILGIASKHLTAVSPEHIGPTVRSWLDRVDAATKNVERPDFMFDYHVTLNNKIFIVAQFKSHPEYIHFHSDLTFTDDDNTMIANLPGGVAGVIRLMRISLALKSIGHSGIEIPLRKIALSKRLLITADLNEDRFIDAFYEVEAALNLVLSIVAQEKQLVRPTSQ
jgi:hypothetical protein